VLFTSVGLALAALASMAMPSFLLGPVGGGVLGYLMPTVMISRRIKKRQKAILLAMPSALDLLTISVEAGLSFDAALTRVADKYQNPLTQEITQMLNEVRLGRPRLEALDDMGRRCKVEELSNFVQSVIQSEQLGVGIANVLRIQSEEIRRKRRQALLASACALASTVPTMAQEQHEHAAPPGAAANYGRVRFPVSCSPQAQQRFEQAVAMLHSFHFPATGKAFAAITAAEPDCAMAWWGVAISQRLNPLIPPFPPEALRRGWEAIQKARAAPQRTERERDWIEAMAAFFQDYEHVPQRTRTLAYEAAMERLAAKYPDDDEAQIFYALAINEAVDLADKTYARQLKAGKILESVQARLPDHPGVTHCLIHTYDYGPLAERGLPAARRYAALAPAAGHALHMPSHIFSTLGLWNEAIPCDLAAIASFTQYYGTVDPRVAGKPTLIPRNYHSLDFLSNAYMQLAQDRKAAALLEPYREVTEPPTLNYTSHTGFAAAFVRYAFDRGAWAEAAALPVPKTPYPQAEAISWFGRAVGAARSGDPAGAKADLEHIHALGGKLADAGDAYWAEQAKIQETAAAAWIALAEGRRDEAVRLMRTAAELEDRTEKHIAMENRLSPMREMLGEMLLAVGDPAAALREFDTSLRVAPNRYRSIAGAAKAAESIGDRQAARAWDGRLLQLTADSDTARPEMTAARTFLSTN